MVLDTTDLQYFAVKFICNSTKIRMQSFNPFWFDPRSSIFGREGYVIVERMVSSFPVVALRLPPAIVFDPVRIMFGESLSR